jgi:hypothetical protein
MAVTPTNEKKQRIVTICSAILEITSPSIRQVAELIGIIVSNFPGAQYGPLHYRRLEYEKYLAVLANKGNYAAQMSLSPQALSDIRWWLDNAHHLKRDIIHHNPDIVLKSDASNLGWGAVCADKKAGGRWLPSEAALHINILELKAAFSR